MNPEFLRHLTLEFSWARLIGMPLFLGLVFILAYLLDDQSLDDEVAGSALFLYVLITVFWGARQASESIFDEIRNNTWDMQKTSALSPWTLTWGKLLGSTSYTWYGGLLCLIMWMIAHPNSEYHLASSVVFIMAGLLSHSLSFLAAVFSLPGRKTNATFSYAFTAIILIFIMPYLLGLENDYDQSILWLGHSYSQIDFLAVSLCLSTAWAIMGCYRLLAEELQVRTLPWVWVVFIVFIAIYLSGFVPPDEQQHTVQYPVLFLFCVYGLCLVLTYLWLLMGEHNPMQLRKLWIYGQNQQWLRFFEQMPCWLVNLILIAPLAVLLNLMQSPGTLADLHVFPLVGFLLLLRDTALFLYFNYSPNPKRATSLTLLCLICLYGLLPALLSQFPADFLAALVFPLLNNQAINPVTAVIIALIQTTLMTFLLWQRWQSRFECLEDSTH